MVAGIGAIVYGLVFIRMKVAKTLDWPGVAGTIISSSVEKGRVRGGRAVNVFEPCVRYEYHINGRRYSNNVIKPCGSLSTSETGRAEAVVQKYQKDQKDDEVMVFYNPDKPNDSCLEREEEVSLLYIGIGILFIIFGWFF